MRQPRGSDPTSAAGWVETAERPGPSPALVLVALATLAVLPVVSVRLSPEPSYLPAMLALVVCCDLLSALFLLRQYLDTGDSILLRLSCAYFFTLVVVVGYGASFPDVLGSHPPLGLYPSTAPWLWVSWHTGFPVLLAAALASRGVRPVPEEVRRRALWRSVTVCVGTGVIVVLVASVFGGHLPVLIHGDDYSEMTRIVGPVMLPLVGLATAVTCLAARKRRGPERWTALAAVASLGDVVLTLLSRYRYSVGWYAGRTLTIAASAAVLIALLVEFGRVKSELAKKSERLVVALQRADELERLQQTLLDNMVDGVTLRAPSGALITCNPAAPRMLGLTTDQLAGLAPPDPRWRALRADGRLITLSAGTDAITTGMDCRNEMIGVFTDGETPRWLSANTVPVTGVDGSLEGVVTTFADVTDSHDEKVRIAQAHQATRERVEAILDGRADCLRIVFQPIVGLVGGEVVGYEALSRFSSEPVRPPDVWFAEAASVGLGVDLELHALRAALGDWAGSSTGMYLSLNVSPETAMSPRLIDFLDDARCDRIVLEVTEHIGIDDYDALGQALARLRKKGLRIAVDDAGAGYSSLRHILNLRPDIIKLDIALTRGIDSDPVRQALAVALVSFRKEIDAVLVAEGIETQGELEVLVQLGLTHGQGYYLGRPCELPARQPASNARRGPVRRLTA